MGDSEQITDYDLVEPISLPRDSHVPATASGPEEYDAYFRIRRHSPGLLSWSRTCLAIQERVLADLARAELTAEEQCEMLRGFLVMQRVTLERWVRAADRLSSPDRSEGGAP